MKVALVYDRVNKWGGAERVLLALHELFPDAPLYTSVYDRKNAPWAERFNVRTSFLQNFPFTTKSHEYFASLMPLAFESFNFDMYDLVISVTSEAAKGIITKPGTTHICYCLTPTRYLWSGYEEYFKNDILRFFSKPIVSYLKSWDMVAGQRPDYYISISKEVKNRIKKYYNRDSAIVYPPVSIQNSKIINANVKYSNYFLIVSRLVAYKHIEIAIDACNKLNLPLVIVGSGNEEKRLKNMSGNTIFFVGNLTDLELVGYYKECNALIFPGHEDLGLTAIEAQSFGKPVIAYKGGGVEETVLDGKSGEFFYPLSSKALQKILSNFNSKKFDPLECKKQADKFNMNNFKKNFTSELNKILV